MSTELNRLEFQPALTDDVEKVVVVFLNTEGVQIHFGVDDEGDIGSVKDAGALQLQIKDRVVNNIRPGAPCLFDLFIEGKDEKQITILNLAGGSAASCSQNRPPRKQKILAINPIDPAYI